LTGLPGANTVAFCDEKSFMRLANRFGFSVALVLHVVPVENAFTDQRENRQIIGLGDNVTRLFTAVIHD
jgi:hypothetical protein